MYAVFVCYLITSNNVENMRSKYSTQFFKLQFN
jgi:hypothetical protein